MVTETANGCSSQCSQNEEMIRIVSQWLTDNGFKYAAENLQKESGIKMEDIGVVKFRQAVKNGEWSKAEGLIDSLKIPASNYANAIFHIRKQQYLEMLDQGLLSEALHLLRCKISPLDVDRSKIHEISLLVACSSKIYLNAAKMRSEVLEKIQKEGIQSSWMLPSNRLEMLIDQSMQHQISQCLYHNSKDKPKMSLLQNHECDKRDFPSFTVKELTMHTDEVWFVQFSHNGLFLASASRDKIVIIWDFKNGSPMHFLKEHTDAVSYLQWSPNDEYLLSCSNDHKIIMWNTKSGKSVMALGSHTGPVTSCAWTPDGQFFISAGVDQCLYLWSLDGISVYKWSDIRASDISIAPDGQRMFVVCQDKTVRCYSLVTKSEISVYTESDPITSIALSMDGRFMLLNVSSQEIHVWDVESKQIIHKYFGHKQGRFVIRSCFGGLDESFILSGSEDGNVYVWNKERDKLIQSFQGHKLTVNSVSWNPVFSDLIASASDDCTIRIWGSANSFK